MSTLPRGIGENSVFFLIRMRSVLQEYNQPETVADQAWSYYQSAKRSMISSLGG